MVFERHQSREAMVVGIFSPIHYYIVVVVVAVYIQLFIYVQHAYKGIEKK